MSRPDRTRPDSIGAPHPLSPLSEDGGPDVDPSFRSSLESDLRVAHATRQPANRRWAQIPRTAVMAPALVVVILLATVLMVARDESVVAALSLRDAHNVVVTLPNGEMVTDPADGFVLADGATVTVGADGEVTINDVMLSAGAVVTVRDGTLVTDVVATTSTAAPDRDVVRDETTTVPPVNDRLTTTVAPDSGEQPRDTRAPTTDSDGDRPADDNTGPRDGEVVHDPPRDGPDSPLGPGDHGDGIDLEIALAMAAGDGHISVRWRVEGVGERPWEIVVVRTTDGTDPDSPPSGGVIVGEGTTGEIIEDRGELPEDWVALKYRVIVLDASGGVVGRSVVQTFLGR